MVERHQAHPVMRSPTVKGVLCFGSSGIIEEVKLAVAIAEGSSIASVGNEVDGPRAGNDDL